MQTNLIIPVIIAGGSGTRLWPLSRVGYPKQFLPLLNDHSLLQETFLRIKKIKNVAEPIIVCQEEYRFLVAEQLRELNIGSQTMILEPALRNTAPAIALAAHWVAKNNPQAKLLILAADHAIQNVNHFAMAIEQAIAQMQTQQLVTFGIKPTHAETAYGYIKTQTHDAAHLMPIEEFVEKPDLAHAQQYVANGHYYWNSGMFLFTAENYLNELKTLASDIYQHTAAAMAHAKLEQDFVRPEKSAFMQCPTISIDYAVMEKTKHTVMMPLAAGWSDIGSWNALYEQQPHDSQGNVLKGNVVVSDVKNSYVHANKRLVAVGGVENIVVVDTPDALLVMDRAHSQSLKGIVETLLKNNCSEVELPAVVRRPWGTYQTILEEQHFLVKKIVVNPGQKLSLQLHHHRAEHWTVVKGTLTVTNGDKVFDMQRDQSTYIPVQGQHRMANNTDEAVEVIEVQIGDELAESDIVRLEDSYGRVS